MPRARQHGTGFLVDYLGWSRAEGIEKRGPVSGKRRRGNKPVFVSSAVGCGVSGPAVAAEIP